MPWLRAAFHDTDLSTTVGAAFQALAIDEKRRPFEPTLWRQQEDAKGQRLEQVWFTGVHCYVGGGYLDGALADIALRLDSRPGPLLRASLPTGRFPLRSPSRDN